MAQKSLIKRIYPIISTLAIFTSLIIGATLIVLYARGYRFNRNTISIEPTGVMYITSNQFRAEVRVNDRYIGRTDQTLSGLAPGAYDVKVTKDNYRDWIQQVKILAERSTPVNAQLILQTLRKREIENYAITPEFIQYSENREKITYLLDNESAAIQLIYAYDLQPEFWDLSRNPKIVLEWAKANGTIVDTQISPDGEKLLIESQKQDTATGQTQKSYLLIDTDQERGRATTLDLSAFSQAEVSWAANSAHLIVDNRTELFVFDIASSERILVSRLSQEAQAAADPSEMVYRYDSDSDSNFYYYDGLRINRINLNNNSGSDGVVTESIKDIEKIYAVDDQEALLIENNDGSYLFDQSNDEANKITKIGDLRYQFVETSPDEDALLFLVIDETVGSQKIVLYTYRKESNDHNKTIGEKIIYENNTELPVEDLQYGRTNLITFKQGLQLYSVDGSGKNLYDLHTLSFEFYMVDRGGEITVFDESQNRFTLNRYTIY